MTAPVCRRCKIRMRRQAVPRKAVDFKTGVSFIDNFPITAWRCPKCFAVKPGR